MAQVFYSFLNTHMKSSNAKIITMRLSPTVAEIWSLKYFLDHDVDFLGSRDVVGHVTIGLATYGFL